jgi:hypothetical protein
MTDRDFYREGYDAHRGATHVGGPSGLFPMIYL